jgi:PHD/YefM family antitoxin component YafN of YafNO toxin-antitoxin module
MTIVETIYAHVKAMPIEQAHEVLDFIEFLESKSTSTPEALPESVTLSRQEWESLQETLYVLQNSALMTQIAQSLATFNQGTGYIPPLEQLYALD